MQSPVIRHAKKPCIPSETLSYHRFQDWERSTKTVGYGISSGTFAETNGLKSD
ncbi:hypothetical protein EV294_106244 [Paenibacillus sp. BK033]|nr:hypothetical protein [Paenibacillus sp. BK720]TCM95873.1 hypothetical protein EV294_106244 [Paenibacillus sp. BK033]